MVHFKAGAVVGLNYVLTGIPEGEEMAYIEEVLLQGEGLLMHRAQNIPEMG